MVEKIFEAVNEAGELIEGVVISPDRESVIKGQAVYNKAFRDAIEAGAFLGKRYIKILEDQGLWSEENEKRITSLNLRMKKCENNLKNKEQSEEDARKHADQLKEYREELNDLIIRQTEHMDQTAEGQADAVRFNYFCSVCILDKNSRKPYFSSLEDFLARGNSEFGSQGAHLFGCILHDVDPEYTEKYPEEIFFKRFGDSEPELTEEQKEVQELLKDIVENSNDEDLNTIEYAVVKKKRGRPKSQTA